LAESCRCQVGAGLCEFLVHFLLGTILTGSREQLCNLILSRKLPLKLGQEGDGLVVAFISKQISGLLQIAQLPLLGLVGAKSLDEAEYLCIASVLFLQPGK